MSNKTNMPFGGMVNFEVLKQLKLESDSGAEFVPF